jgi:transcription elongation factor Elf1
MTEPTHFNCPHCTYAYLPSDPRFAVPKGKANRVMACPACGGAIRVWAPGASPSAMTSVGGYILIAIVIIVVVAYFRA